MAKCFSLAAVMESLLRCSFTLSGLRSTTIDIGDSTTMHCWVPKAHKPSKPTLLLLHGFGSHSVWQFHRFVSPLTATFNLYAPDLVFFGGSNTTRPDRTDSFQARCVMAALDSLGVQRMSLVGVSYGGFVGYSMAAQFRDRFEKVVLCCAGVCVEQSDLTSGMMMSATPEGAAELLLPQTAAKARDLLRLTFVKPPKALPSCLLNDFIEVMSTDKRQERLELLQASMWHRKMSDLPKITQPTLIIWGEQDLVFPNELAHRLKRHLGDTAELIFLKNAGHAVCDEKPTEVYKLFKRFLTDSHPSKLS